MDSGLEIDANGLVSWDVPADLRAAGASTTFKLRMLTKTEGMKNANARISNNDSDESPFDFRVTGNVTVFTALTFDVTVNGRTSSVTIRRLDNGVLRPELPATLHGLDSSPDASGTRDLANSLARLRSTEPVYFVDWSAWATGLIGAHRVEEAIKPVGQAVARALLDFGFIPGNLRVAAHSWGTYVGAEMAEMLPGRVRHFIAVDPGEDHSFDSYQPNQEVNFSQIANWSWSFRSHRVGPDLGSESTPITAHEAFVVRNPRAPAIP